MNRLPLAFFSAAALCALAGMVWGIVMGSTQDFSLSPAHAHLNLVGWATLALMGTFYQLSGRGGRIGWANWAMSTAGAVVMAASLAVMLSGNPAAEPLLIGASILAILGMAAFVVVVLGSWRAIRA